jgi:N-acetylglutamate synthase-like GNAT family acetyltransferase
MPMTLRQAVLSDMDMLSGVFRRASLSNEHDRGYLLAHPDVLELASDGVLEGRTTVAVDTSGSIVGFASYLITEDVIELEDLFVDPQWMRRGIGRTLVLAIAGTARELGFDRLEVTANPHATEFYDRTGFVADRVVETEFNPAPRMQRTTA